MSCRLAGGQQLVEVHLRLRGSEPLLSWASMAASRFSRAAIVRKKMRCPRPTAEPCGTDRRRRRPARRLVRQPSTHVVDFDVRDKWQ